MRSDLHRRIATAGCSRRRGGISAVLALCAVLAVGEDAVAQTSWAADAGVSYRRFEQQVKSEIGGVRGERLIEESQFTLDLSATYKPIEQLSVGAYVRYDGGSRMAGRFAGLDADNKTVVEGEVGGAFHELWVGPLVRGHYSLFYAELGYGALGFRSDDARDDLTTEGASDAALRTSPSIAWLAAVGLHVPLAGALHLNVEFEYRVRYYDRRSSGPLDGDLAHGTQGFTPLVGLGYGF